MNKKKKIYQKVLVSIICLLFVITGNVYYNKAGMAETKNEPSFEIKDFNYEPREPVVDQDIVVTGKIHPNDFEMEAPEKRIVMVLDISESMNKDGHDRMTKLKDTAKQFLEKMKDVPNLKMSIVAFSSDAYINPKIKKGNIRIRKANGNYVDSPDYECYEERFYGIGEKDNPNDEHTCLYNMIDSLEACGGTSTGEGLRKAEYMFEKTGDSSSENVENAIIFMTDGIPAYYSSMESNDKNSKKFYITIDKNTIRDTKNKLYLGGSGSTKDEKNIDNATEYAKLIGKILCNRNVTAYSIAFELKNEDNTNIDGVKVIKDIHSSLIGKNMNSNSGASEEENKNYENILGFYRADDVNAIEEVFNSISDDILNSYSINNVKLNLENMNKNFSLNIGGNIVELSNIKYSLTKTSGNRLIYSGDDVPFTFRIKADKEVKCDDVFKDCVISIPWNNSPPKTINIDKTEISVKSIKLPEIHADLDPNTKSFYGNGPFEVKYKIRPEDFELGNGSGSGVTYDENAFKDVVFLIDESIPVQQVANSILGEILSDLYFCERNTRYSIIVYGENGYKYFKLDDYYDEERKEYTEPEIRNSYNNMKNKPIYEMNKQYVSAIKFLVTAVCKELGKNSTESSIKDALDKAIGLLEGGRREKFTDEMDEGRSELASNKNIVIIGKSNISDIGAVDKVNPNYKVITFNYGKVNSSTKDSDNNIRNLHYKLIGKEMKTGILDKKSDYYYLNIDYDKYINEKYNDSNDSAFFAHSNNIGGINGEEKNNINNSIMGSIKNNLKDNKTNVQQLENEYKFEVKLKFQVGQDIQVINGLNELEESNEILIKYNLNVIDNKYIYKASEQPVNFSIEPKLNDYNKNKSILTFGNINNVIYKGLDKKDMKVDIEETPIINIYKPEHGVYLQTDSKDSYYIDTNEHTFLKGSFGTFAAEIKYAKNGDSIKLTLPKEVQLANGQPEIWKVVDGKPTQTGLTLSGDRRVYSGKINNVFIEDNDQNTILVIYTLKMPLNKIDQLTSEIKVNNGWDAYANFRVDNELPDLF